MLTLVIETAITIANKKKINYMNLETMRHNYKNKTNTWNENDAQRKKMSWDRSVKETGSKKDRER